MIPNRPVVNACPSMGVHLTNILSSILEPLAIRLGALYELISTEDMLANIDIYNGNLEEIRAHYSKQLGFEVKME